MSKATDYICSFYKKTKNIHINYPCSPCLFVGLLIE